MEEIEVGEYVRTVDGNIGKIEQINKEPTDDNVIYAVTDNWVGMNEEIVKHSKNIIDLIELGDYVNGYLVGKFLHSIDGIDEFGHIIKGPRTRCVTMFGEICNNEIETVVTKEQFANAEYKVKE